MNKRELSELVTASCNAEDGIQNNTCKTILQKTLYKKPYTKNLIQNLIQKPHTKTSYKTSYKIHIIGGGRRGNLGSPTPRKID